MKGNNLAYGSRPPEIQPACCAWLVATRTRLASDTEAFIVEKNGYLYGSLYKQAGGPFSASTVSGPYAFRMDGIAFESSSLGRQNVPTAIAGLIAGDAAGKLTGHGDVSQKGALSAATLTGTYSVAANGRGTLTLPFGLQTVHYSAVLVSSDKLLLASMDDITSLTGQVPPFLSGIAEKQGAATFSSSSLSGPYVYYALGYSYTGAGRFEADGISNIANGLADYRTVESPTSIWMKSWLDVPFTCTFTVAADGRITASFTGTNAPKGLVGYMIAPDRFFILLDGDAAAPSGSAFAQSDLPFDDTKLDGRYAVQFILPPVLATGWMTREATAQPYPLVYSWMDEYTAKTEWQWSFYSPDALGRASFLPVGAGWSFGSTMRYYAISGSRMLIMSTADIPGQGNQLGWMEKID